MKRYANIGMIAFVVALVATALIHSFGSPPPPPPVSYEDIQQNNPDSLSIRMDYELVEGDEAFRIIKKIHIALDADLGSMSGEAYSIGSRKKRSYDKEEHYSFEIPTELSEQIRRSIIENYIGSFESPDEFSVENPRKDNEGSATFSLNLDGEKYYVLKKFPLRNDSDKALVEYLESITKELSESEFLNKHKYSKAYFEGDVAEAENITDKDALFSSKHDNKRVRLFGKLSHNPIAGEHEFTIDPPPNFLVRPNGPNSIYIENWSYFTNEQDLMEYDGKFVFITGILKYEKIWKDQIIAIRNITEIEVANPNRSNF